MKNILKRIKTEQSKKALKTWIRFGTVLIIIAMLSWYVLSMLQLVVSSSVIITNSDEVLSARNAVRVENLKDDVYYLEDSTSVKESDIKENVDIAYGKGIWYDKDTGTLATSKTLLGTIKLGLRYGILVWVLLIGCLILLSNIQKKVLRVLLCIVNTIVCLIDGVVAVLYSGLFYYKSEAVSIRVLVVLGALAIFRMVLAIAYAVRGSRS